MYSVLLHDERLEGNTPSRADSSCFTVKQTDPLERVLSWINVSRMMNGPIDNVVILCHGYVNPTNNRGGHGLQLSQDGVYVSNVDRFNAINGKAEWIFIHACSAADVDPTVPKEEGDGQELCRHLAVASGAKVIAAVRLQYYTDEFVSKWNPFNWKREIYMGGFEGPIYGFFPDGTVLNVMPWLGDR